MRMKKLQQGDIQSLNIEKTTLEKTIKTMEEMERPNRQFHQYNRSQKWKHNKRKAQYKSQLKKIERQLDKIPITGKIKEATTVKQYVSATETLLQKLTNVSANQVLNKNDQLKVIEKMKNHAGKQVLTDIMEKVFEEKDDLTANEFGANLKTFMKDKYNFTSGKSHHDENFDWFDMTEKQVENMRNQFSEIEDMNTSSGKGLYESADNMEAQEYLSDLDEDSTEEIEFMNEDSQHNTYQDFMRSIDEDSNINMDDDTTEEITDWGNLNQDETTQSLNDTNISAEKDSSATKEKNDDEYDSEDTNKFSR